MKKNRIADVKDNGTANHQNDYGHLNQAPNGRIFTVEGNHV